MLDDIEDRVKSPQDRHYAVLAPGISLSPDEDGMSPRAELDMLDAAPLHA